MFDFIFKYFLVFPKIQLGGDDSYSGFGILIGEIALIAYFLFIFKKKIPVTTPLLLLMLFLLYFIFVSSFLNSFFVGILPVMGTMYFLRTVLYIGIFVFCYSYFQTSNEIIVRAFFTKPFQTQFWIGVLVVLSYHILYRPSLNRIMWDYDTGLRLIPFAGMTFNKDAFFFLKPIGGGSGNLLCSWALAVLVVSDNFNLKENKRIIIMALLTGLLTFSRGGLLTISFYILYMLIRKGALNKNVIIGLTLFTVVLFLGLYFAGDQLALGSIFSRLESTFQGGALDSSSLGRIKNYHDTLAIWIQNPFFIFFGMGYDETILRSYTGYSIVESFFLQILISGGLIALVLFIFFYNSLYSISRINLWFNSLWKFILFESLFQWTITGGDFLSPHVLFVIMAMLGFGYKQYKNEKINYQKAQNT